MISPYNRWRYWALLAVARPVPLPGTAEEGETPELSVIMYGLTVHVKPFVLKAEYCRELQSPTGMGSWNPTLAASEFSDFRAV
jgi:hypothetical protein